MSLLLRFLYNRLALIIYYLLDIDLASYSLSLFYESELNKSQNSVLHKNLTLYPLYHTTFLYYSM